jgi:hypothetical protein
MRYSQLELLHVKTLELTQCFFALNLLALHNVVPQ